MKRQIVASINSLIATIPQRLPISFMQISSSRFCFHKTEWVSNTYRNRHNCNLDLNTYNLYITIYFLHCQLLLLWVPLWHDAAETQTHRMWSNPFLWHSLRHNSWSWGEASVSPHLSRNRHSSRSSKQALDDDVSHALSSSVVPSKCSLPSWVKENRSDIRTLQF